MAFLGADTQQGACRFPKLCERLVNNCESNHFLGNSRFSRAGARVGTVARGAHHVSREQHGGAGAFANVDVEPSA
jgi:hypothetical protein